MHKIKSYKVIKDVSLEKLETEVNALVEQGWTTNGGLSVASASIDSNGNYSGYEPGRLLFIQSLVQ